MSEEKKQRSTFAVAVAGLLLPGLGYVLVGERRRAIWVGGAVLLMFLLGILIAGVRVIEVPGWGEDGRKVYYDSYYAREGELDRLIFQPAADPVVAIEQTGGTREHPIYKVTRRMRDGSLRWEPSSYAPTEPSRWVLQINFRGEVFNHIWFVPQLLMGAPTVVGGYLSVLAGEVGVAKSHARLAEIGTLFTAVAGMLNLLTVIGAASKAGARP